MSLTDRKYHFPEKNVAPEYKSQSVVREKAYISHIFMVISGNNVKYQKINIINNTNMHFSSSHSTKKNPSIEHYSEQNKDK